jgi:hypothetical protein
MNADQNNRENVNYFDQAAGKHLPRRHQGTEKNKKVLPLMGADIR